MLPFRPADDCFQVAWSKDLSSFEGETFTICVSQVKFDFRHDDFMGFLLGYKLLGGTPRTMVWVKIVRCNGQWTNYQYFPHETSIQGGFSVGMFDYQRVFLVGGLEHVFPVHWEESQLANSYDSEGQRYTTNQIANSRAPSVGVAGGGWWRSRLQRELHGALTFPICSTCLSFR